MELNETLKKYGFTQVQLDLLESNAAGVNVTKWAQETYWIKACRFVEGIGLLPPLSYKQEQWLGRLQKQLIICEYEEISSR